MSHNNFTGWFPPEIAPARVGVYETQVLSLRGFSYWDGNLWGPMGATADEARSLYELFGPSLHRGFTWRGLAADPAQRSMAEQVAQAQKALDAMPQKLRDSIVLQGTDPFLPNEPDLFAEGGVV